MATEDNFNSWYNNEFNLLFEDLSRNNRYQQQNQTRFFEGGSMAIDMTQHGFEHAKKSLASVGQHGLFAKKSVSEDIDVVKTLENSKQKKNQ